MGNNTLLSELYVAYFNKAPDSVALNEWLTQINNSTMSLSEVAYKWSILSANNGSLTDNAAFITNVYTNVLNRTPDTAGYAYWLDKLNTGKVTKDYFIFAFVNGAKAPTGSATDAIFLNNKAEVGVLVAASGITDTTFKTQVIKAVSTNANTITIASSIIDIAKKDNQSALTTAIETLNAVSDLNSSGATTTVIANIQAILASTATKVTAGTITNLSTTLTALTTTIKAAIVDSTFVSNASTLATSIQTDPDAVTQSAQTIIQTKSKPGATLTYSVDNGVTYASTVSTKDADTLKIKAIFNEIILDSAGATITIDNSILAKTAMTKVSTTEYVYSLNVPTGDITQANISIGTAIGASGNVISTTPIHSTFTIDNTKPTLTTVSIQSNNALSTSLAKVNDTVKISFTSNETLGATPTVTIDSKAATVVNTRENYYTATLIMSTSDSETNLPFTIDFKDVAGNVGTRVTAVTNSSSVIFDKTVTISSITIPNVPMYVGDTVSATITATETGLTLKTGSHINGFALTNLVDNGNKTYTATFTVINGGTDVLAATNVSLSVTMIDLAGNESAAYVTAISNSGDAIDATATTITDTATWNAVDLIPEKAVVVNSNVTLDGSATKASITNVVINSGNTLTGTAAELTALKISGAGTVAVTTLQATEAANFSNFTVTNITANVASSNVNFTGSLGDSTVSVSNGATFTLSAAKASGVTIAAAGTGNIAILLLDQTLAANLSTISSATGTITAAFGATGTFTGNLGSAVVTVADNVTMTAAYNLVNGKTINNDGSATTESLVVNIAAADAAANLSTILGTITKTANFTESLTFTGSLNGKTAEVMNGVTVTTTAAIANGATIRANDGTGHIAITGLESVLNADLSHLYSFGGTVSAAFGTTGTFTGSLGTHLIVNVANGVVFTTTSAIADTNIINTTGTGTAVITTTSGTPFSLNGNVNFSVTGLNTSLDATYVSGDLSVTVTGVASIITGSKTNTINATALTDGQLLTLSGNDTVSSVTIGDGDLNATAVTASVSVTAGTGTNIIKTGSGNDTIVAGGGADTITAGRGGDTISGGAEADTFVYAAGSIDSAAASNSTTGIDKIIGLVVNKGSGDLFNLSEVVVVVNKTVTGSVTEATFVTDMNKLLAVGAGAGFDTSAGKDISAVLVTVSAGDKSGKTYLAIDSDANDTFTTADLIIDVTGITQTSALAVTDFI